MNTPPSDPREQFASFIVALFPPDDTVEVRAIDCRELPDGESKLSPQQWWHPASALPAAFDTFAKSNAEGRAIYIGANPRTKKGGSKAEDVALARSFFVDFDGGVTPEQALARIAAVSLPIPSVVVGSGHGVHAYWLLAEPMSDLALWTRYQKALIAVLDTDGVIHDPPRIMRAPGFVNNKRQPHVPATLLSVNDTMYGLDQFPAPVATEAAISAGPASVARRVAGLGGGDSSTGPKNLSRKTLSFLHSGEVEGKRNPALFRAACDYAGNEIPVEQALCELGAAAERCGLPAAESAVTIKSAYAKPRGPSRKVKPGKEMRRPANELQPDDENSTDPDLEEAKEDDDGDNPPQSEKLARLAHELYRFGRTELDEAFAVPKAGPHYALMFTGNKRKINNALARAYRSRHGRIPNAAARADALAAIEGETHDMEPTPVYMRLAPYRGGFLIDLGRVDGQVVHIHEGIWEVLRCSPVLFRRSVLTSEMAMPVRGGCIEELRDLLNITERDWPLFLGWMVACFVPDIPHPVLMLGGEQGTGKSTAARFAVQVVDPSPAPLRSPPKDLSDWVVAASQSWVVVLDNLSGISEWLADAICRAATGDGLVKRALFTDSELAVLNFRRVVVITSIDPGALRGDLGDRLILIDLEMIPEEKRRDDKVMATVFEAARPRLLGAVLDLAAKVFARKSEVQLKARPRMADFAGVLGGLDLVLGTSSVDTYMDQRSRIAGTVVEGSAIADAVRKFIGEVGEWRGTAGELLSRITPERSPPKWPKNPSAMAGELRRVAPALRSVGMSVVFPAPTDKKRHYHLFKSEPPPVEGRETAAQTAQPPDNGSQTSENGDSAWAVARAVDRDRPGRRPAEDPSATAENSDSGHLGGSGGEIPHFQRVEPRPAPPGSCRACGHVKWWSCNGRTGAHRTCGSCHPPAPGLEDVVWSIENEVLP